MQAKPFALLLALIAAPAAAGASETGRYQIATVSGGFVRLDTMSGAMTFCRDEVDKFRCEPLAAAPLGAEAGANAGGKRPDAKNTQRDDSSLEDFDNALGMMEKAMRAFMAMARENPRECAL